MLYKLYPHQEKGLNELRESFKRGLTRPMFYASVAFGKTVVMAHIVASALDKGKRVLVVCPYTALINQTSESFINQGIPQGGIIQAGHHLTNSKKRLQIGTIQSLSRRGFPETDLILFDEAHILYESFIDLLERVDTPVIGFSGSPFTKGLGKYYNNLINPISMSELIDKNYLSEYIAFAPCSPDMTGVKTSRGDYENKETGKRMSTPQITGSIVETWLKRANSSPTVCFATNVSHANFIGTEFDNREVTNVVITAKTPMEEREEIFKKFKRREILILINVGTLVAGFDSIVHCVIYAKPTKSKMTWIQSIGRGLRVSDGKEKMILLDHSGTIERLGFPEDISINCLHNGEKEQNTSSEREKEEIEKLPKKCPKCDYVKPASESECKECGFTPRATQDVEVIDGELKQIKGRKQVRDRQEVYSELLGYQIEQRFKGKNLSDGWVTNTFRDMFNEWPNGLRHDSSEPSQATRGFIKHKNIKWARRRK